jgi:hypothetical protein
LAKERAMASPIPELDPVTMARRFSSNRFDMVFPSN